MTLPTVTVKLKINERLKHERDLAQPEKTNKQGVTDSPFALCGLY